MKWKRTKSRDVIDVRGAPKRSSASGGSGGLPIPGGLAGLGGGAGIVVVIIVLAVQFLGGSGDTEGFSVEEIFGSGLSAPGVNDPQPIPPGEDPQRDLKDFSTYVFVDAQETWAETFQADQDPYEDAQLVLFADAVRTDGCGSASSAVGPFYCPADGRVYLDLSFYEEMERQLGAGGDFAWAYVIAHEMGHHVQAQTGTNDEVARLESADPDRANELSVRTELQADCYAGVWASTVYAEGDLEAGDIDEAFTASEAIGDDRLQSRAGGTVDPDSFTHGTSEQRRTWFENGYESGDPAACDTFTPDSI
ncbi:MAG: KPN_02809 family neutral zinc metallopeptidase [Solirubrobacterales bacterium]